MRSNLLCAGIALGLLSATGSEALAKSVCYQIGEADGFFRLDVKRHGALTTSKERRTSDSPLQTTYSAQGTQIVEDQPPPTPPVVGPISGTVTVARGTGSIAGFTLPGLFFVSESVAFMNCWSDEPSATPENWQCRSLTLFPTEPFGPESFTLARVDPSAEPLCSAFTLPAEEEEPSAEE